MKKGIVIWLTGMPCSGKTTISKKLEKYFQRKNLPVQILDGDAMRQTINSDLGFSKKDRDENIRRAAHIAKLLSDNGINVVVAFVSPYRKMREFARGICDKFVEVYLKCSIDECVRRDSRGVYKKKLSGQTKNNLSIKNSYEEPKNPEIIVNTEEESLAKSFKKIVEYIGERYGN